MSLPHAFRVCVDRGILFATFPRLAALASFSTLTLAFAGCRSYSFPEYPDDYHEYAFVANTGDASVSVLDLVTLRTSDTLKVGADPVAVAANPQRSEVYVLSRQTGQSTGSLAVLDVAKRVVLGTIPVGREPVALAVAPGGARAYVADTGSDAVSEIDLDRRRVISTLPAHHPNGLAIAPNGRSLAVTSGVDGSVTVYALNAPALNPSALNQNAIHPHTPEAATKAATAKRASFRGCPGATSPVILPDSSKVFASCSDGHQVLVVGLALPPDSWAVKQDAALIKDRLLTLLDVGKQPAQLTVKPDGGEIFVSNAGSDSVSEIATTQNEVGSTYPIGNRPGHGLVSADGSRLWVSSSGADAISLYSIDDGKFVSSLPAGGAPDALAFSADEHLLLAADARTGDIAVIRTQSKLGPVLLTMLPAGANPTALAVKALQSSH